MSDPRNQPQGDIEALRAQAERGEPEAQFRLGQAHVARAEPDLALPWFRKAMGAGHVAAGVEVARIELYLTQSDEDIAEAVALLRLADAKGDPVAPYLLALAALGDRALPRDFERIGAWLLRAARRRHPPALRALALYFGRSPHAPDRETSNRLLRQACMQGDTIAAQLLAERARYGQGMAADPALCESLYGQLAATGRTRVIEVPEAPPVPDPAPERPDQLDLRRLLTLPPGRILHQAPRVVVHDGVLSAEDCRFVAALAHPHLRRSRVFDPEKGNAIEFEVRTSQDASIDPILEDFWLRLLQLRMAAVAGGELTEAEPLAVLRYGPGEQYHPHHDYIYPNAVGQYLDVYGQRRTTLCCYLNPVAAGGATDFPKLGVRVQPLPGRAVVFDNLRPDGEPEPDSLHAGLPVEAGEKWLATLWLRQRPIRRF